MIKFKNIFLVLSLLAVILIGSGFFYVSSDIKVNALATDNYILYNNQVQNLKVKSYKYKNSDASTPIADIINQGYIMLENETNSTLASNQGVRFIIEAINEDYYLPVLKVNIFLNGKQLSDGGMLKESPTLLANNIKNNYLDFRIDNNVPLKYFDDSEVTSREGEYVFEFQLQVGSKNQTTNLLPDNLTWYRYSFIVLDQKNYGYEGDSTNQFPTMSNVNDNPLYVTNTGDYFRQKIYNYNKVKDGKTVYPALTFDAERYYISIKRIYNNVSYNIYTRFTYYTSDTYEVKASEVTNYGILDFVADNHTTSFKFKRNLSSNLFIFKEDFDFNSSKALNYTMPIFYELGVYEITYNYQMFIDGQFVYDSSSNSPIKIGTDRLINFGYTPMSSINHTGERYFVSFEDDVNADVSNLFVTSEKNSGNLLTLDNLNLDEVFTQDKIDAFASTNCAPVWLSSNALMDNSEHTESAYYYSQSGADFVGKSLGDVRNSVTKKPLTKTTNFGVAGYYIVVAKYSYEELLSDKKTDRFCQVFAFRVKNSTPNAVIKSINEDSGEAITLNDGGFTKSNVYLQIDKPGIFDSEIVVQYRVDTKFNGNYTEYQTFTPKYKGEENDYTIFNQEGKYYIKVFFNERSSTETCFTIDKQDLKDQVYTYGVDTEHLYNSTSNLYSITRVINDASITNQAFTVLIKEKKSGSPITCSLITYEIEYEKRLQSNVYNYDNFNYIYVDYLATTASSLQEYKNIVSSISSIVSSNYVFNEQKIYIFIISDKSGYEYVHIVFLDKTEAKVLQNNSMDQLVEPDEINIVSEKSTMIWGNAKALRFQNVSVYSAEQQKRNTTAQRYLQNNYENFKQLSYGYSILIPITNIEITSSTLENINTGATYLDYKQSENFVVYPNTTEFASIPNKLKGEKIYHIFITDKSGNVRDYRIEMNMDKSLGKAFTTDNLGYNISSGTISSITASKYHGEKNENALMLTYAGSKKYLVFEWKDVDSGAFKISSITYDFYPLTFDVNSNNFPYSDTKESGVIYSANFTDLQKKSLLVEDNADYKIYFSGAINNSGKGSRLGKYIITRTYISGNDAETNDEYDEALEISRDTRVRTYTYYVDNNAIIETPNFSNMDESYIGQYIKLLFNNLDNSSTDVVEFNEFYREEISKVAGDSEELNLILTTNMLPITVRVPNNKYCTQISGGVLQNCNLKTFDLVVTIDRYSSTGRWIETKKYATHGNDGYLVIDNLTIAGIYKIRINDNVVFNNTQLSQADSHKDYIALGVVLSSPQGDIYVGDEDYKYYDGPLDLTASNNAFIYKVSNDIDRSEIVIYRREKTSTGSFGNYEHYRTTSINQSTINLPAFAMVGNILYSYQYKLVGKYQTGEEFTQITPVMGDLDNFNILTDSSTNSNYVLFTFSDPLDKYTAKIDGASIKITQYKLNGSSYDNGTILSEENGDYILEERCISENRSMYAIKIYKIDENNPRAEYKYEIYYQYKGDPNNTYYVVGGVNYFNNTSTIIIDKTAPSYNLKRIASTDENVSVLTANGLTSAYESKFYNNNGKYAYANVGVVDLAISDTFEFKTPATNKVLYSEKHEAIKMYYRKYNKYNLSKIISGMEQYDANYEQFAYQSLIAGDPEYYQNSVRLRFNANTTLKEDSPLENWNELAYDSGLSFYQNLYNMYGESGYSNVSLYGYYEIIEMDEAGNSTIYTIILKAPQLTINAMVNGEEKVINSASTSVSSLNNFNIKSINSLDRWFTINVSGVNYIINPTTDLNAVLASINAKFQVNNSYTVSITSRFGSAIYFNLQIASSAKRLGVASISTIATDGYYAVVIDSDEELMKLKSLNVGRASAGNSGYEFVYDENGNTLDSRDTPIIVDMSIEGHSRVYYFSSGVYQFEFTDNYGKYTEIVTVGYGTFNIQYNGNYVSMDSITYTSDFVRINYTNEFYSVSVTRNGDSYLFDTDTYVDLVAPEKSVALDQLSGGVYNYVVTITCTGVSEPIIYKFCIYNLVPGIQSVVDANNENMISVLSYSRESLSAFTSKNLKLTWAVGGYNLAYNVKLNQYDANGDIISSQKLSGNTISVTSEGTYELVITNSLFESVENLFFNPNEDYINTIFNKYLSESERRSQYSRSFYFIIKTSDISMYQVYEKVSGNTSKIISPSANLLDISMYSEEIRRILNNRSIDQLYSEGMLLVKNYLSIYDIQVEIDGDKNLLTNFSTGGINYSYDDENIDSKFSTKIIVVYSAETSSFQYVTIFAITKIVSNSNFLNSLEYQVVNGTDSSTKVIDSSNYSVAIYDAPIRLHWASYYGVSQNEVYAKYYFNDVLIGSTFGKVDNNDASLILDTAGKYYFEFYDLAGNRQKFGNENGITIVLRSEVIYTINNQTPIYGAVYNNDVALEILDPTAYVGKVNVTILRNGENYTINPTSNNYNFTEQGYYKIIVNANVRESNQNPLKALKPSEICFTIIKMNEKRYAYEFVNINGYEIKKVIKNGIDITNAIKENENVSTIYSLYLSSDNNSYGTGDYHIFVQGNQKNELIKASQYDFYVSITDQTPFLNSSVGINTTSVKEIQITYNSKVLLDQIGECKIIIGNDVYHINENNALDEITTLTITTAGTYYVTLKTEAGNTISMFKVIKKDPLNAITIILIVVGVLVFIAGVWVFIKLRVRMKIK